MNKRIRLSPTGIDYGDYAWNFASGCGNNIEGKCNSGAFNCWAYPITQRFKKRYLNGFKPTIYPEALLSPLYLKKPSRILCAFMGDLFWDCPEFDPDRPIIVDGYKPATLKAVLYHVIQARPEHTFIFLTKQPQNLIKWSPFPPHCYVGVTVTKPRFLIPALDALDSIQCSVRYLSIEPLLESLKCADLDILLGGTSDWVIIGACTGTADKLLVLHQKYPDLTLMPYGNRWSLQPPIEWVREIVQACDKAGIPVFLKNNLLELVNYDSPETAFAFNKDGYYRQEMPK